MGIHAAGYVADTVYHSYIVHMRRGHTRLSCLPFCSPWPCPLPFALQDPTPANNRAQFISYYADLVTRISASPEARKRLIVDILNEPDARGWGWDVMGPLYLNVMDAVYPVNPDVLFLVEGCAQSFISANWGDGGCCCESVCAFAKHTTQLCL